MERLTIRDEDNDVALNCGECSNDGSLNCDIENCYLTAICRLASIEDILGPTYDLTRLRELVEADRDGKVEIHSLAIGTSFFFLRPSCTRGGIAEKGAYMPCYLECQKCKGPCDKSLIVDSAKTRTFAEGDSLLIGVNAFITKEAAEKALEERKC